jgi:hypothetical protein
MLPEVYMMTRIMNHHNENGRKISLKHWMVIFTNDGMVERDGVLIQIRATKTATIHPIGYCECAECGAYVHMSMVYVTHAMNDLYCTHCTDPTFAPFQMSILNANVDEIQQGMPTNTMYRMIFTRFDAIKANLLSYYHELKYLKNKTTKDLYHDVLAKRVIMKWKRRILQKKVASILYTYANIGIDASIMLSQKIR